MELQKRKYSVVFVSNGIVNEETKAKLKYANDASECIIALTRDGANKRRTMNNFFTTIELHGMIRSSIKDLSGNGKSSRVICQTVPNDISNSSVDSIDNIKKIVHKIALEQNFKNLNSDDVQYICLEDELSLYQLMFHHSDVVTVPNVDCPSNITLLKNALDNKYDSEALGSYLFRHLKTSIFNNGEVIRRRLNDIKLDAFNAKRTSTVIMYNGLILTQYVQDTKTGTRTIMLPFESNVDLDMEDITSSRSPLAIESMDNKLTYSYINFLTKGKDALTETLKDAEWVHIPDLLKRGFLVPVKDYDLIVKAYDFAIQKQTKTRTL